jgi:hypothetical protein
MRSHPAPRWACGHDGGLLVADAVRAGLATAGDVARWRAGFTLADEADARPVYGTDLFAAVARREEHR